MVAGTLKMLLLSFVSCLMLIACNKQTYQRFLFSFVDAGDAARGLVALFASQWRTSLEAGSTSHIYCTSENNCETKGSGALATQEHLEAFIAAHSGNQQFISQLNQHER